MKCRSCGGYNAYPFYCLGVMSIRCDDCGADLPPEIKRYRDTGVTPMRAEQERLQFENATLKAERDAAVEDMNTIVSTATECLVCKNRVGASGCPIRYKKIDCFEWRGVKAKEESENE